ncbi:bte binding protein 4 [Stemphylium lycopersici]|uniref:Bte binding protein 4 n=1 Tax=Stemphylium lycopersici TaxID=183478 RepID=A0A364MU20_STELY|nr:bte binding protein 4 [Stemphylium lycopersici]RAR03628.1 bte binding protein 4 [Stemphylium lycopersici]RAR03979.1 bte binding protein 4 [Stemphylium lycopersici]
MPAGIQRQRIQHRRQHSTPTVFDAPTVRPSPANIQRRSNRSGMSLDLRGLNLEPILAARQAPYQDYTQRPGPFDTPSFQQEDSTHSLQVAHSHRQPQPGPQDTFLASPVQISPSTPRTPRRINRAQSPQPLSSSPSKPPTEQQLKELHEHIQSVYGSCGQVFINILPTPTATPQKPAQLPSHESFGTAPHPSNLSGMSDINLEPTSKAMTFDFDNPEVDMGYDSSSYYTSDALSPSPASSPRQKSVQSFFETIEENQEMMFSQPPALMPTAQSSMSMNSLPASIESFSQPQLFNDLEVDASYEFTGIAPEEVQKYISEQDATTGKWTCLYQGCAKVFGRRENIRSHVQTHLGDRQYKCNGCGKCFVRQHDLKRHAKIHSGNKPYKCPCGAGFARQDALTRHRQRGMCVGGFPDAVRRQAKRGRPKKNRPDMEQRTDKATRTRRALVSAPSSSVGSPYSEARSPSPLEGYEPAQPQDLPHPLSDSQSYGDSLNASDPFSFETSSSPYTEDAGLVQSSYASSSYASDPASINILQQLSQHSHTPPMSPADVRPHSSGSANGSNAPVQPSPLKESSSPSRSSIQSNQFTTPPTSPIDVKDNLDELFSAMPDSSYSQFDLEMKAMGDFTSLDSSSYDLLDFTV